MDVTVVSDKYLEENNQLAEEYFKDKFIDWEIVNLSYPLRTSKKISESHGFRTFSLTIFSFL